MAVVVAPKDVVAREDVLGALGRGRSIVGGGRNWPDME
jgi:hypothetical protein